MWKDPIVEEVRAIREKLTAEAGYDLRKMFKRYHEERKSWKGKVVGKVQLQRQRTSSNGESK